MGITHTPKAGSKLTGTEYEAGTAHAVDTLTLPDQGGDPSSPSAGNHVLYTKTGGAYVKDSAGAVVGPLGGSGSGGGYVQAYVGYNTVGGSWATVTANREYMKKITLAAATDLQSIGIYVRPSTDNVVGIHVGILSDTAGSPDLLIATDSTPAGGIYLSNSASMPGSGRWLDIPITAHLAAGNYWLAFMVDTARIDIAYDSGTDRYFTSSLFTMSGTYPSAFAVTTSAVSHSIRASTITGSGGTLTVEEADGSPTDSAVTKLVAPNGSLAIASHVATLKSHVPPVIQQKQNYTPGATTNTVSSLAVATRALVAVVLSDGRHPTGITQTNVTWTIQYSGNSGSNNFVSIWTGAISGGSAGTSAVFTFASSTQSTCIVAELDVDPLTSVGTAATASLSTSASVIGPLTASEGQLCVFGEASWNNNVGMIISNVPYALLAGGGCLSAGFLYHRNPQTLVQVWQSGTVGRFGVIMALS